MQKLPEALDGKMGQRMRKEKDRSLSTVTSGVTTSKSFLLLVEGSMRPSLDDALANLSTSSSRLFCYILTLDRAVNQEMHLCR